MKKKKTNPIFLILSLLFLLFISLYISLESGYYESKIAKKTIMTEESMKKFENDVKNGEAIDLNSYVYEETKDYSNSTTDIAIFLSENVEKFMTSGITNIIDIWKSLFT